MRFENLKLLHPSRIIEHEQHCGYLVIDYKVSKTDASWSSRTVTIATS